MSVGGGGPPPPNTHFPFYNENKPPMRTAPIFQMVWTLWCAPAIVIGVRSLSSEADHGPYGSRSISPCSSLFR
jgi:hypothetical protein